MSNITQCDSVRFRYEISHIHTGKDINKSKQNIRKIKKVGVMLCRRIDIIRELTQPLEYGYVLHYGNTTDYRYSDSTNHT